MPNIVIKLIEDVVFTKNTITSLIENARILVTVFITICYAVTLTQKGN